MSKATAEALIAAGCFWGVEAKFRQLEGVLETEVGYTGGNVEDPDYQSVCTGDTGHAEALRICYDPEQLSYEAILDFFFSLHDPTTPGRQGPDVGSQYRSAIFYATEAEYNSAEAKLKSLDAAQRFSAPIVTQLEPASRFYPAEDYHQRYFEKRGLGAGH